MPVNKANIDALIALLWTVKDENFSMKGFAYRVGTVHEAYGESLHTCGTAGCLAGWSDMLQYGTVKNSMCSMRGKDFLRLSHDQMITLFYPNGFSENSTQAGFTRRRAIAVLEHLRDTEQVDWTRPEAVEPTSATPAAPAVLPDPPPLPESLTRLLNAGSAVR